LNQASALCCQRASMRVSLLRTSMLADCAWATPMLSA
jgi:hypothetical protein